MTNRSAALVLLVAIGTLAAVLAGPRVAHADDPRTGDARHRADTDDDADSADSADGDGAGDGDDDDDAHSGPDRPTSGVMSLWSGRTLGNGHSAVAAGVGWPGLFVELVLAPSSRFNIGGRLQVNYGSPLMGIGTGIGGDAQVPIRYHFLGRRDLDLALAIRPGFTFGQGALVGQQGTFSNDFGWGTRLDVGVLLGGHVSDAVTLTLGVLGGAGLSGVTGTDLEVFGSFYGTTAVEIVVSRDTMIFAMLEGGYGLARAERYDTTMIFRMWLGLAYEL